MARLHRLMLHMKILFSQFTFRLIFITVFFLLVTSVRPAKADGYVTPIVNINGISPCATSDSNTFGVCECNNFDSSNAETGCTYSYNSTYTLLTLKAFYVSNGLEHDGSLTTSVSSYACIANSSAYPTCQTPACNSGYVPSIDGTTQYVGTGSGTSCISSTNVTLKTNACYPGAVGSISVCTSDGVCTGAACFATTALACADYATKGVYANAHIVATLVSAFVCKTQLVFDDGHTQPANYYQMKNAVPCNSGDTACNISQQVETATAASATTEQKACTTAGGTDSACATAIQNNAPMTTAIGTLATQLSSGSSSSDISSYCSANPNTAMCKLVTAGTFSGTCGSTPSCTDDDPVACANANADFTSACALAQQYVSGTTEANLTTSVIAGTDSGTTSNPAFSSNHDSHDMSTLVSSGSPVFTRAGLSDISFATGTAYAVTLPLSRLNTPLTAIGVIGVAISFCAAIFIVFV